MLRRFFARKATERHPLVQRTVNNGCSFESCPVEWEGQEWHGWHLCPEHLAQCRTDARTPSFV